MEEKTRNYKVVDAFKDNYKMTAVVELYEGDSNVRTFRRGFALGTPQEEVKKELERAMNLFFYERERAVRQREFDKKSKESQKVVDDLKGVNSKA